MNKIAVIGDIHYGINFGPYSRETEIDKSLEYITQKIKDDGADCCIFLGDVFHSDRPYPYLLTKFRNVIKKLNHIPVYILVGNHDWSKQSEKHALLGLESGDNLFIIDKEIIVSNNGYKFMLLPYRYDPDFLKNNSDSKTIIFSHRDIAYVKKDHFKDVDFYLNLNGHEHTPLDSGKTYNVGSILRFTMAEKSDKKRFMYLEFNKDKKYKLSSISKPCRKLYNVDIDFEKKLIKVNNKLVFKIKNYNIIPSKNNKAYKNFLNSKNAYLDLNIKFKSNKDVSDKRLDSVIEEIIQKGLVRKKIILFEDTHREPRNVLVSNTPKSMIEEYININYTNEKKKQQLIDLAYEVVDDD